MAGTKLEDEQQVAANKPTTTSKRYFINKINKDVSYYYLNYEYPSLVWRNAFIFGTLHLLYAYGFYLSVAQTSWASWMFMYVYAVFGGLGITAGAHRLWSHRSYKARLPLRIFLMLCNCVAVQNDLIEWCRDHRLHHKSSETDADPHNSNRGWFFAHMGWLLQKKHPKVIEMGHKLDLSDLYNDSVLVFQKKYYWLLALLFGFVIPISICYTYFGESLFDAVCVGVWRYVTSLHCTWFVNSAAHIWGSQDYDTNIQPRESCLVSVGALGEGFHNYHHTFPYDYSTSEHGGYFNFTTTFIDSMSLLGLAYDLRSVDTKIIRKRQARTGKCLSNKGKLLELPGVSSNIFGRLQASVGG